MTEVKGTQKSSEEIISELLSTLSSSASEPSPVIKMKVPSKHKKKKKDKKSKKDKKHKKHKKDISDRRKRKKEKITSLSLNDSSVMKVDDSMYEQYAPSMKGVGDDANNLCSEQTPGHCKEDLADVPEKLEPQVDSKVKLDLNSDSCSKAEQIYVSRDGDNEGGVLQVENTAVSDHIDVSEGGEHVPGTETLKESFIPIDTHEEGEISDSSQSLKSSHKKLKKSKDHSKGHKHSRKRSYKHEKQSPSRVVRKISSKSSKSRSRSRSPAKIVRKVVRRDRSRSKSSERKRTENKRHRSNSRNRSTERKAIRSKSPIELPSLKHTRRHRSRSRGHGGLDIDKKKLLEIARKNALLMFKQANAGGVNFPNQTAITSAITAGGKTVDELTDFCKLLSQKGEEDDDLDRIDDFKSVSSDSESEKQFHHPFKLKDRPSNIVMNIRNCAVLPVKTLQEKAAENAQQLRLQFPVSSGQQHRKTESEWVPVVPKQEEKLPVVSMTSSSPVSVSIDSSPPVQPPTEVVIPTGANPPSSQVYQAIQPQGQIETIEHLVSERLNAMKMLHQNPANISAHLQLQKSEQKMMIWSGAGQPSGSQFGQFGLGTEFESAPRILTPAELAAGAHAWAHKDQLVSATPVSGGMGMSLLQKMGWKPGEGLGKNHEGTLEPLSLPVKMDKRGLVCAEERKKVFKVPPFHVQRKPTVKSAKPIEIQVKHPVSMLIEYCTKRHFRPPIFTVISESGPSHKKEFLFKVEVNGFEYKPADASPNKKQAKSEAAIVALKSMGLMPTTV